LGADHDFPILNILVPQSAQVPSVAGLPFFIVTTVGFCISFFALHFMQYASITPPFYFSSTGPICRIILIALRGMFDVSPYLSSVRGIESKNKDSCLGRSAKDDWDDDTAARRFCARALAACEKLRRGM